MDFNSVKFFLDSLMANIGVLDLNEWVVTNIGSRRRNDEYYWTIYLKNSRTKEEKIVGIPCYKD